MHFYGNLVTFLTVDFFKNWSIIDGSYNPQYNSLHFWPNLYAAVANIAQSRVMLHVVVTHKVVIGEL